MERAQVRVWAAAALGILAIAVGFMVPLATDTVRPFTPEPVTVEAQLVRAVGQGVWLAAMLVVLIRQPANPLWRLILGYLLASQIWVLFWPLVSVSGLVPTDAQKLTELFDNLPVGLFAHILLAFPTGRLRHRSDRIVVGAAYVASVVNPWLAISLGLDGLVDPMSRAFQLVVPAIGVSVIACLLRHWAEATPVGRRQLWPVVLVAPFDVAVQSAWYALPEMVNDSPIVPGGPVQSVLSIAVPAAVLLGALRLRQRRAAVADLALILGKPGPRRELQAAMAQTLGDPTLELAVPASTGDGWVDVDGAPYLLPDPATRTLTVLDHGDRALGVIVTDPAIGVDDPDVLVAVGSMARLALENEHLAATVRSQLDDVRISRARLVDAADAERRRVERDLHDGAQQRLVALAMRLDVARTTDGVSPAVLDEVAAELHAAVAEVRDLARGLHPTILAEAGLGPAIEALAERAALPVTVSAPAGRFPPTFEATAYFVVAEALTNATRHARASTVHVDVRVDGGALAVSVRDDGRGGASVDRGSGLRGLADRAAAMGGRLFVDSPENGGTTVRAELPLPA